MSKSSRSKRWKDARKAQTPTSGASLAALGLGTWLAANRFQVVSALALSAAVILVAVWLRRRGGLSR